MLYVYHGTDIPTSVSKAHKLIESLRAKRKDTSLVRVEADKWNRAIIEENLAGQGLFTAKYLIFLDRISENAAARDELIDLLPAIAESENIFVMLEAKPNAELKRAIDKHAAKVIESTTKELKDGGAGAKVKFNIFALSDAVGARDPFRAWSLYRQAVDAGNESESILGTLFWQVKSMLIGMRPAGKYSKTELENLLKKLIVIYHDGHRGEVDLELAIEQMLLGLR